MNSFEGLTKKFESKISKGLQSPRLEGVHHGLMRGLLSKVLNARNIKVITTKCSVTVLRESFALFGLYSDDLRHF